MDDVDGGEDFLNKIELITKANDMRISKNYDFKQKNNSRREYEERKLQFKMSQKIYNRVYRFFSHAAHISLHNKFTRVVSVHFLKAKLYQPG